MGFVLKALEDIIDDVVLWFKAQSLLTVSFLLWISQMTQAILTCTGQSLPPQAHKPSSSERQQCWGSETLHTDPRPPLNIGRGRPTNILIRRPWRDSVGLALVKRSFFLSSRQSYPSKAENNSWTGSISLPSIPLPFLSAPAWCRFLSEGEGNFIPNPAAAHLLRWSLL